MAISIDQGIRRFFDSHNRFLVLGHIDPDGDCIASQLVMARFLRRLGKTAEVFSLGPFDRPEITQFAGQFRSRIEEEDLAGDPAVVVVDCSTPDRLGGFLSQVQDLPTIVIDHHSSGIEYGEHRLIDPKAPAVTYLIQLIMEEFRMPPDQDDARLLLFGLCADTGFFRHLGSNSAPVFQSVARLVDTGVGPNEIYRLMYGDRELAKYVLLGKELTRVESYHGGRLLVTWETIEDQAKIATRGSDELYRLLQSVKDVQVVALIRGESENTCSVGLRSNGRIDVGSIAGLFGGGGHRQAAGFTVAGRPDEVKALVLKALDEYFASADDAGSGMHQR